MRRSHYLRNRLNGLIDELLKTPIGVPGVVDVMLKYGEWLSDRAKTVKRAQARR